MPAVLPLLEAGKAPIQAVLQGDKPLAQATKDLVGGMVVSVVTGANTTAKPDSDNPSPTALSAKSQPVSAPLGQAPTRDVLKLIVPATAILATPQPVPLVAEDNIKVPAPSKDQIVTQTDALVKGTIMTVNAIRDKVSAEPSLAPAAPQPLLKGVAVSTVAPLISSGSKNLQEVISGEKTVTEAVGAVASDAIGAVVTGTASNVGQKLISGAATALGASPATAEAVGLVAAFTSARLSNVVLEGSGAKMVVMDQTKNWLDRNVSGAPLSTEPVQAE